MKLPCIADMMTDAEAGCAYEGAKEDYILTFEDQTKVRKIISTLWQALPNPKSKRKMMLYTSSVPLMVL